MKNHLIWVVFTVLLIIIVGIFSIIYSSLLGMTSMIIILLSLFLVLLIYEEKIGQSKDIAVIAILGAFSAAARVPFAALPNIQPSTFIILVSGYVFGPFAGFMIGAETAILSNFFLGQGPWTPWQMLAWGIIGILGWMFRVIFKGKRYEFAAFLIVGFLSGYLYGIIMNVWYWLAFIYPHTWQSFLMVEATSFWFDTLHAIGNVVFIDLFGVKFINILERYKIRFGLFSKTQEPSVS